MGAELKSLGIPSDEENSTATSRKKIHPAQSVCRIGGEVLHGDKIGRLLGFPTANMIYSGSEKPAYGIYAARVFLADGRILNAAANFGIRPTFSPPKELLETHIIDFAEDVYGRRTDVELVRFLRPEVKFEDMGALSDQLRKDCNRAREALATLAPSSDEQGV